MDSINRQLRLIKLGDKTCVPEDRQEIQTDLCSSHEPRTIFMMNGSNTNSDEHPPRRQTSSWRDRARLNNVDPNNPFLQSTQQQYMTSQIRMPQNTQHVPMANQPLQEQRVNGHHVTFASTNYNNGTRQLLNQQQVNGYRPVFNTGQQPIRMPPGTTRPSSIYSNSSRPQTTQTNLFRANLGGANLNGANFGSNNYALPPLRPMTTPIPQDPNMTFLGIPQFENFTKASIHATTNETPKTSRPQPNKLNFSMTGNASGSRTSNTTPTATRGQGHNLAALMHGQSTQHETSRSSRTSGPPGNEVVEKSLSPEPITPTINTQFQRLYGAPSTKVQDVHENASSNGLPFFSGNRRRQPEQNEVVTIDGDEKQEVAREEDEAQHPPRTNEPQGKQIHNLIFARRLMTPRAKLESMLKLMIIAFENIPKHIDIKLIRLGEICRKIDDDHVDELAIRFDGQVLSQQHERIMNQSFFVVYEEKNANGNISYVVVDGNQRLAAAMKYNETGSKPKITTIRVDYILKSPPTFTQSVIISTLASEEAERDRLEYQPEEIMRIGRYILKYHPDILDVQRIDNPGLTGKQWAKKFELIVRDKLSRLLKVPTLHVLAPIWRTAYIDDDSFELILPCFIKHGNTIKTLEKLCNAFQRRREAALKIYTNAAIIDGDDEDFENAFKQLKGQDWQYTFREKGLYNFSMDDEDNMRAVMGETYDEMQPRERNKCLEVFLKWKGIADITRREKYPDPTEKAKFAARKFAEWLKTNPDLEESDDEEEDFNNDNSREDDENSEANDEANDEDGEKVAKPTKKTAGQKRGKKNATAATAKKFKLKAVAPSVIQSEYLNQLQQQPHVASLLTHFIKAQSSNFDNFPADNLVTRNASPYENSDGSFNWKKFHDAANKRST